MTGPLDRLAETAMVLAAGYGKRLQPLTLSRPKPLVAVAGRPLIDHALDRLVEAGFTKAVVNTHYLAEMLEAHLARRTIPEIAIAREDVLLDTGGGVVNMLDHVGDKPFLAMNSDVIWRNAYSNSIHRLAAAFDPEAMDALLLLQPSIAALGYQNRGDFEMRPDGRLSRRRMARLAPFVFTGVQVLNPASFAGMAAEPFSLNRIYDRAIDSGRLFGIRHDGDWADAGHRAGLKLAHRLLGGDD